MRVLVTGAAGQVGSEFKKHALFQAQHEIIALARDALDVSQANAVNAVLQQYQPQLVINTAAYTKVDQAEQEPELAHAINAEAPGFLAVACNNLQIPLIHISTDYIFDGEKTTAYTETDKANPQNVYGKTKWLGEEAIRAALAQHIILRVSWVYGVTGHNFVKTILRLSRERDKLTIVADQHGGPTSASAIVDVIYQITNSIAAGKVNWGTYHYCGTPAVSWYQFAQAITQLAAQHETLKLQEITPIKTTQYVTPAKRPQNSTMSCEKIIATLNIKPQPWLDALTTVIQELYK